jgi:hypothetical protein
MAVLTRAPAGIRQRSVPVQGSAVDWSWLLGSYRDQIVAAGKQPLLLPEFVGVLLMRASGGAAFAVTTVQPWRDVFALLFGIGAGLVLDEFTMLLRLQDVYWSKEGRIVGVNLCLTLVTALKGKAWPALLSTFVTVVGLVGAARLATPDGPGPGAGKAGPNGTTREGERRRGSGARSAIP